MSRNHLDQRVRDGATQPIMTIEIDDDTAKLVAAVLKVNEDATAKESGIYWHPENSEPIKNARKTITHQLENE